MAKKRSDKVKRGGSFRRSYREDYQRDVEIPGVMQHLGKTFGLIAKNFKLFGGLALIAVVLDLILVGFWGEAEVVMTVIILAMVWLVTLYLARHRLNGRKVKLKDGIFNAMTPLSAVIVIVVVGLVQCVPIFLLTIAHSAAVETEFLATPFYALLFFVFAALMILLSGYLLSGTLMALVAVSAPGLYPIKALSLAEQVMLGRRVKFIIRLVALVLVMGAIWAAVILPLAALETWLKGFEWATWLQITQIAAVVLACLTVEYVGVYLYMYYRWIIET